MVFAEGDSPDVAEVASTAGGGLAAGIGLGRLEDPESASCSESSRTAGYGKAEGLGSESNSTIPVQP